MEVTILNISLTIGLIYWIIGVSGSWKRAFWLILFSLVSFIIALQYSNALLELVTNNSVFYKKSEYAIGAFSFLLLFGLVFIILIVLYHILWDSKQQKKVDKQPGLLKFAQSILTGLVGWLIGVVLAITIVAYISGRPVISSLRNEGIASSLQLSANFMIRFGMLFSVNELPAFLRSWLVI